MQLRVIKTKKAYAVLRVITKALQSGAMNEIPALGTSSYQALRVRPRLYQARNRYLP